MTMSPVQLLTKQLDDVNKAIEDQEKAFNKAKDTVYAYKNGMDGVTEGQAKKRRTDHRDEQIDDRKTR